MTLATQTLYDWLLFLHVLAAMVWVGGGVMLAVIAARVLRDPDPGAVGRFTGSLRVIGPLALAPATVAVLGLGIGLVVDTDAWESGCSSGSACSLPRSWWEPSGRAAPPWPPRGPPNATTTPRRAGSSGAGRGATE